MDTNSEMLPISVLVITNGPGPLRVLHFSPKYMILIDRRRPIQYSAPTGLGDPTFGFAKQGSGLFVPTKELAPRLA